jgi:hypothetical protein
VLQGVHARGRFVDPSDERQRPLEDRLQPLAILDPRGPVFVLDDEMGVGDVEREQLARGELVIEPVNGPFCR